MDEILSGRVEAPVDDEFYKVLGCDQLSSVNFFFLLHWLEFV
jgi:hypothetical protein